MLARLRVVLVRHGDAADRPGRSRLGQLADLRPLQLVHLAADPRQGAGDQREELGEFRAAVAGREPGDAGIGQPELGAEPSPDGQTLVSVEHQAARAAAELPDQPPGSALPQPVQVAADLVGPGGGLPAEGDRTARLAVRAARHHGGPVRHGQLQQSFFDPPQVPPHDAADPPQGQGGRGVGDVLDGGPGVDVLACLLGYHLLQGTDQAEHGVGGLPGLLGRVPQVEPAGLRVLGDEAGGAVRDHARRGLGPGQRDDYVEPAPQPALLAEHVPGLGRAPQVLVEGRVGNPGAHRGTGSAAAAAVPAAARGLPGRTAPAAALPGSAPCWRPTAPPPGPPRC